MISGKIFLFSLVLCLGACMSRYPAIRPSPVSASNQGSASERAYQEGKVELNAGHSGLAIVAFERALRLDPLSVAALNGIGAAYDDLKRYDIAQGYYRRALALAPTSADTLNNLAVSMQLAGDPKAGELFARAAASDPNNVVISANIKLAHYEQSVTVHADQAPPATEARPEDEANPPMIDRSRPSLERSGVSEVRLELPTVVRGATTTLSDTSLIPVAAIISQPAQMPIASAAPVEGQSVPASIAPVQAAAPNPTPPGSRGIAKIAVSNCAGRNHMARRFRAFLRQNGLAVGHIANAPQFNCEQSVVLKHTGQDQIASDLARTLPFGIAIQADDTMAEDVRLVLGRDLLPFDRTLEE